MLNNNLLFSLLVSFISSIIYYLIKYNNGVKKHDEIKNDIILLFGIIFVSTFLLKICISNESVKPISGGNMLTHTSRPPF
jgi:hypothetical protein